MLLSLYPSDKVADSGVVNDDDGDHDGDDVSLSKLKTLKLLLVVELVVIVVTKLCTLGSDTTNLTTSFGLMLLLYSEGLGGQGTNKWLALVLFAWMLCRVIVLRY